MYLDATTVLIPHWLPWHVAWAYSTGAAFIAGGAGSDCRRVCALGLRAIDSAAGPVRSDRVGTPRVGGRRQRFPMGRVRRDVRADGWRLGGGGFIPRRAFARRGQALAGGVPPSVCC